MCPSMGHARMALRQIYGVKDCMPVLYRKHTASRQIMLYSGLAYALMAAWGIFTQATAGSQPLVASTVIGAGSNIYKLQQLFPPGPSESGGASGKPLAALNTQISQIQNAAKLAAACVHT